MIINRIKCSFKNFIKKTPPFNWFYSLRNVLKNDLNQKINVLYEENNELKKAISIKNNEISTLREELLSLSTKINAIQLSQENTVSILNGIEKTIQQIQIDSAIKFDQIEQQQKVLDYDAQFDNLRHQLTTYADKKQFKQLDAKINSAFAHANYLYNKGLHPDFYEQALSEWFYQKTGQHLNLENPVTYNEKLQWLKLYDCTPLKTLLVDKYLVRNWVTEKIGSEYLIPLIGAWNSFDEIIFDKLPQKFVLKTNHGSSWNMIVKDKSQLNYKLAKNNFDNWMSKNFAFHNGFELQYLNVPRKIIAEKYLDTLEKVSDYRFMCFNGEVKMIWLDTYRDTEHFRTFFTPNWEKMNLKMKFPVSPDYIPQPQNYEKMLEIASTLSQGFSHVRVDLYNVDGKIYFGEMTFSSTSGTLGFEPKEFEYEMGHWIKLPEKQSTPRTVLGLTK